MNDMTPEYPINLLVDYPDREMDFASTFFRPFTVLPILIILSLVSGPTLHATDPDLVIESGGVVFGATALMLLFRRKYPRWWYDWNVELTKFGIRVWSYAALLTDIYPSTDQEQSVHLEIQYPQAERDLDRWLPLVKWFLAIPHYVVLAFLSVAGVFSVIVAWFAILFTGRYPRPLFEFLVGVFRWWVRVAGYAFLLVTDTYPPFTLHA